MEPPCHIEPNLFGGTPIDMLRAWPAEKPMVMLHSGQEDTKWGQWSILASPQSFFRLDDATNWVRDIDSMISPMRIDSNTSIPFTGGWIGYFSYDLGHVIEPTAQFAASKKRDFDWPLIQLAYCPHAYLFRHRDQKWFFVSTSKDTQPYTFTTSPNNDEYELGPLTPSISADQYIAMVERTLEYIAAGDIFQANMTQQFSAQFNGSSRALAMDAFTRSQPRYGAYLEFPNGQCLISLSPELFLHVNGKSRDVVTRPIKGTRPSNVNPEELVRSAKDVAELTMIVDLMRNDLGRVCEFGSVRVPQPRVIESHPTVHHGVGEVTGRLCENVRFTDVLKATFPGGSVTGAPKIRAMQIIDELEPAKRGPYCGAIGYISHSGDVCLNIAIRTLLLSRKRRLEYFAGAGIVADSDPVQEYRECLDKVAVLRQLCSDCLVSQAW